MVDAYEIYDHEYYHNNCGPIPYEEPEIWMEHFGNIADHLIERFHPIIVLDAGCAMGYLVAALRDRGVEAYGVDISEYAISKVREDVKPYCFVGSLTEPLPEGLPKRFDLVTCIEVLEHLYEEDGAKAIANLCTITDTIVFSSSSTDLTEVTHVNVQQPEYWVKRFAENGFHRNVGYDFDHIIVGAMLLQRTDDTVRVAEDYERKCRLLRQRYEDEQRTNGKLAQDIETVRAQRAKDEQYYQGEIARLTNEAKDYISRLETADREKEQCIREKADDEKFYRGEIARLTGEVKDHISQLEEADREKESCLQEKASEEQYFRGEIERLTAEVQDNIRKCEILSREKNQIEQQAAAEERRYCDEIENLTKEKQEYFLQLEQAAHEASGYAERCAALQGKIEDAQAREKQSAAQQAQQCKQLEEERDAYKCERDACAVELGLLRAEMQNMSHSRGYHLLCRYYLTRDRLLPKGSRRRELVKRAAQAVLPKKSLPAPTVPQVVPGEQTGRFYTSDELARQDWCRAHPLSTDVVFSIVVPVFNTPIPVLQAMIFSVKDQIYPHWELCIVDASQDHDDIMYLVEQLSLDCDRIKYKKLAENRGISGNTIEALAMASGDFIALLDHDDMIAPNALYEYAAALENDPEIDFFYSDKDMVDESGTHRLNPLYKPEYSPEIMYSANYLTHFCAMRREVLERTAGYDPRADGAQDWDIFLKMMAQTSRFKRIDRILYHWRIISTSVASGVEAKPYALDAQIYALQKYIGEKNWPAKVYFQNIALSRIKVDWQFAEKPVIAVAAVSDSGKKPVEIDGCAKQILLRRDGNGWDSLLKKSKADVLLFVDADACLAFSEGLAGELAAWAMHPEIGFAAPQLRAGNKIVSCGLVYDDDAVMDLFGGHDVGFYGQMGHSEWYRDLSCFRGVCLAVERRKFLEFATFRTETGVFALSAECFAALDQGLRNVYDHYAWADVDTANLPTADELTAAFKQLRLRMNIPETDPYFDKNCTIDVVRKKQTAAASAPVVPLDKYTQDAMILALLYDFTHENIRKNNAVVHSGYAGSVRTMVWFLQEFDYVFYAGLYTIFRTASYLQRMHGIRHTFVFISGVTAEEMMERVCAGFPELGSCKAYSISSPGQLGDIPGADGGVCTLWTTAYYLLKFNKVKRKFYFIQDYEPLFYPGGSTYAQTEATYRFGFYGIANTQGMKDVYETEYGGRAVSLDPSVDTGIFYPDPGRQYKKRQYTVFFYGRPGHSRNGFELGAEALKELKRRMGDRVRIVTAGASYDTGQYGLNGIVENLGRLKVEQTGDLYRRCDAGLVMMYTRHPSYLPYELMACGCCVVSNYNAYTTWFLKDGVNSVVCEPSASSIAEAVEGILKDEARRKQISEQGARQIKSNNPSWDESLEKVARFIQSPDKYK